MAHRDVDVSSPAASIRRALGRLLLHASRMSSSTSQPARCSAAICRAEAGRRDEPGSGSQALGTPVMIEEIAHKGRSVVAWRPNMAALLWSASAQSFKSVSPTVRQSARSSGYHHLDPRRRPARLLLPGSRRRPGTTSSHRRRQRAALEMGRRGDADVVLSHAPKRANAHRLGPLRPPPAGHAQRLPDRRAGERSRGLRGSRTPSPASNARRASAPFVSRATGLGPTNGS